MRIVFLAESFLPTLGGGETHLHQLGRRLVEAGGSVSVVTRLGRPGWPRREVMDGVEVVRVRPSGGARAGKYLMVPAALGAVLRRRAAEVLVVRGTRVLGLPGLLLGRGAGLPVVLQPEVNGELSGEVYWWGRRWDRPWARAALRALVAVRNPLLRDADAFVAMSRAIGEEMRRAGAPAGRVHLIPHGVDVGRFRPAEPAEKADLRRGLGLSPDGPLAVSAGRLLRGKGLETLLEAWGECRAPGQLVLVGAGDGETLSVEGELRARAARPDLAGRVVLTGRVADVAPYLRAADVFAFPSRFEALGLALIEAGACGLACLGSRTGGIVDVIEDGASGRLLPPGDVPAWTRALEEVLGEPNRRAAWGARAREVAVSRFNAESSFARYWSLFRELAGGRRPAAGWAG